MVRETEDVPMNEGALGEDDFQEGRGEIAALRSHPATDSAGCSTRACIWSTATGHRV